jgi:hypothetical protein
MYCRLPLKSNIWLGGIVHYHVDQCTKNKLMIQIPMPGLFLTCTERPFLLCTHNIELKLLLKGNLKERKKVSLLGKAVPCSWWQIPILSGPLLEVDCLCAPCPSLTPPHNRFTPRTFISIKTTLTCLLLLLDTGTFNVFCI